MLDDHRRKAGAPVGKFSHRASLPSASLPGYPVTLTKPGCRIKTRQGKPVDRSVAAYQSRALAIADNGVVLDEARHPRSLQQAFAAKTNKPDEMASRLAPMSLPELPRA